MKKCWTDLSKGLIMLYNPASAPYIGKEAVRLQMTQIDFVNIVTQIFTRAPHLGENKMIFPPELNIKMADAYIEHCKSMMSKPLLVRLGVFAWLWMTVPEKILQSNQFIQQKLFEGEADLESEYKKAKEALAISDKALM